MAEAHDPRPPADVAGVRSELRRLGYLDHRVERFLLQDALRARPALGTLLVLASKVGALAGAVTSVAAALALAAANGSLARTPFDLVPLVAHLFVPSALGVAAGFLGLCAVLVAGLELRNVKRIDGWAFAIALLGGALVLGAAFWRGRELAGALGSWPLAALAAVIVLAAGFLVRVVHDALLGLAIRLTDLPPRTRLVSRRSAALWLVFGGLLVGLPAVFAVGVGEEPAAPAVWTVRGGGSALLVGIDGVLPEEIDLLLARDALPGLGRLRAEGVYLAYRRPVQSPATFWTTVATGIAPEIHGVTALDSFRPLGVATPLARSGPLRPWWRWVATPLGLAEYRPVLSGRRRAHGFWELAARAGVPAAAVGWWSTYPAEAPRGAPAGIVAHGAYRLLGDRAPEAVAPPELEPEIAALRGRAAAAEPYPWLRAALGEESWADLAERALRPDLFHRVSLRALSGGGDGRARPGAAALYLPGIDLAADGFTGGTVAFADLLRAELRAAGRLLGASASSYDTVVVVIDPGRRADHGDDVTGRAILWRRDGCAATEEGSPPTVDPRTLGAALVRALGLPQSAELPEPPAVCSWPPPPGRVDSFGRRSSAADAASAGGGDYLDNLRSLGYL